MNESANNSLCKQHSGFKARIETLESNVTELWKKWNGMQKILFMTFGAVILNLLILVVNLVMR